MADPPLSVRKNLRDNFPRFGKCAIMAENSMLTRGRQLTLPDVQFGKVAACSGLSSSFI